MTKALNFNDINGESTLTQRELGAYYTPDDLTSILSRWAIRTSQDNVFEPSFGGCGFLQSAVTRLAELGCAQPTNHLCGCDIDPKAFEYLSNKLNTIENINHRFLLKDFMETQPTDFSIQRFDAVIGNPPYISSHNLSKAQKEAVNTWVDQHVFILSKRASLWAYFVAHSLEFMQSGGRMAWVLPGSLLFTEYGGQLLEIVQNHFSQVWTIKLGERIFLTEGTEERTVILLCDQYGGSTDHIFSEYCETLIELAVAIENLIAPLPANKAVGKQETQDVFLNLSNTNRVVELGDYAKILIGTVTGANHFFILKPTDASKHGLGDDCLHPILSKFSYVKGVVIHKTDVEKWKLNDASCLIFHVDDEKTISNSARIYASTFNKDEKNKNQTFKKRGGWLAADDKRIPDGFLSYMAHHGPRLVLNQASLNSTNSIHRIFFNKDILPITQKLIVISLYSTFSQLSAEIESRSYGSGVLKLEPSEAKKIKLIFPENKSEEEVEEAFSTLDTFLRANNLEGAQNFADGFVFRDKTPLPALLEKLNITRRQRRRS